MKKLFTIYLLLIYTNTLLASTPIAANNMLLLYQQEAKLEFNSEQARKMWNKTGINKNNKSRSCASCHNSNITKSGKHIKTKK